MNKRAILMNKRGHLSNIRKIISIFTLLFNNILSN